MNWNQNRVTLTTRLLVLTILFLRNIQLFPWFFRFIQYDIDVFVPTVGTCNIMEKEKFEELNLIWKTPLFPT